jgi:hypothetical protein
MLVMASLAQPLKPEVRTGTKGTTTIPEDP